MKSFLGSNSKPKDWSVNNREAKLEYIYQEVEQFKDVSNYRNREVLLAIFNEHDLNQRSYESELWVTEYEVEISYACVSGGIGRLHRTERRI